MNSEMIQSAIREPSSDKVSDLMSDITPNLLRDVLPSIFVDADDGMSSELLAEQTLDQIFTVVETKVLGESVDFVIDRFGDRIIDMVTGNMSTIFERVAMMLVGG